MAHQSTSPASAQRPRMATQACAVTLSHRLAHSTWVPETAHPRRCQGARSLAQVTPGQLCSIFRPAAPELVHGELLMSKTPMAASDLMDPPRDPAPMRKVTLL
jgi:hypothetical protein